MHGDLGLVNVSAGYGQADVLRDVAASFPPSTVSCILGPNGAGKTTLLRAISGYIPLRSGAIMLDGADIATLTPRRRAQRIAMVPQVAPSGVPLSVRELVALARYAHRPGRFQLNGKDDDSVKEALAAMQLNALADRKCESLSGGEWRRALIAQGLAQDTPVLLLDEPTAFLDPPTRYELLCTISQMTRERGLIVIAVLHDPALAAAHTGHVFLLRDGRAIASGTPGEVLTVEKLSQLYNGSTAWLHSQKENRL